MHLISLDMIVPLVPTQVPTQVPTLVPTTTLAQWHTNLIRIVQVYE